MQSIVGAECLAHVLEEKMYSDVIGPYQWLNGDVIVMYSDVMGPYQRPLSYALVMCIDVIGPHQWLHGDVLVMYSDVIGIY